MTSPRALAARIARAVKPAYSVIEETISGFSRDRGDILAAGLAFYTLLSMAPLVLVAVAIAGVVLGEGSARAEVRRLLEEGMGVRAARAVEGWVDQAAESGGLASIVGVVLVLFGASRVAVQLRSAMNQIWNVGEKEAESFKKSVGDYLRRRFAAFVMIVASGPVLLAIFASRAVLMSLDELVFAGTPGAGVAIQLLHVGFSTGIVALLTAVVFGFVPDVRIGWRSVWIGAALTSVLFNAGNVLVGLYIARAGVADTYGAAGSVVIVMLWLYFSAQLFLLGAEFTQVHATRFGHGRRRRPGPAAQAGPA